MSKKFHRDVWVGLVLLLFCAAVLVNAVQISGQAGLSAGCTDRPHGCLRSFHYIKNGLRLTKEQMGEYSYPLTVKNSKYAFLFMFFYLYLLSWISIYYILDCNPDIYAFYTKVSETEVIQD